MPSLIDNESGDGFDLEAWKANLQSNYEEKIVKAVLVYFDLRNKISELKKKCYETTGQGRLNFDWFYEEYSTFPVLVMPRNIPYIHKIDILTLFTKFTTTTMFKAFEQACELDAPERAIVMVFNWPGLGRMCMHNYMTDSDISETKIVRRINYNPPQTFVIERFTSLLDSIKERWSP